MGICKGPRSTGAAPTSVRPPSPVQDYVKELVWGPPRLASTGAPVGKELEQLQRLVRAGGRQARLRAPPLQLLHGAAECGAAVWLQSHTQRRRTPTACALQLLPVRRRQLRCWCAGMPRPPPTSCLCLLTPPPLRANQVEDLSRQVAASRQQAVTVVHTGGSSGSSTGAYLLYGASGVVLGVVVYYRVLKVRACDGMPPCVLFGAAPREFVLLAAGGFAAGCSRCASWFTACAGAEACGRLGSCQACTVLPPDACATPIRHPHCEPCSSPTL